MYAPPCSWRTGTKSIEEFESDSLRSSVSSPGIPKTCLTPSASRHSTNTSDARRFATRKSLLTTRFRPQELRQGRRPSQVIALTEVDTEAAQRAHRLLVADELRDGALAHSAG